MTWYHIVLVRDHIAKTVKFYVNMELKGTMTNTSSDPVSAEGVVIGNDQDSVLGGWDINSQSNASI